MDKDYLNRRTFAIISHPDAGKTTVTEKLLLFGGALVLAGTVKGRKALRHATSDWMMMEQERGISITTSVMQFMYQHCVFNLLDTPGHEDFSEDTYRTLTAVDSALMVIDAAKGVEPRTVKLMGVCRLRNTPIMTFINKLDREGKVALDLLDEVESVLKIQCAPMTWPIGMGREFKGIYHLLQDTVYLFQPGKNQERQMGTAIVGLNNPMLDQYLQSAATDLRADMALIKDALPVFDKALYLKGVQTPVYFGSAMNNFGVQAFLDDLVHLAPPPQSRLALERIVKPEEITCTGFVFKIQANMDPKHHDRIAFLRLCSGSFKKGMKLIQVRTRKMMAVHQALTFMAGDRRQAVHAQVGDIIGLPHHGGIQIGDTFSEGENLTFTGIPYFAPELFKRVRLTDPLKSKALLKGLIALSEEGAVQVFRSLNQADLIIGAIGTLQFDVIAYRLQHEYHVPCQYENTNIVSARWVYVKDDKVLTIFKDKMSPYLALDGSNALAYLAPTQVHLQLTEERYPDIVFRITREHGQGCTP